MTIFNQSFSMGRNESNERQGGQWEKHRQSGNKARRLEKMWDEEEKEIHFFRIQQNTRRCTTVVKSSS